MLPSQCVQQVVVRNGVYRLVWLPLLEAVDSEMFPGGAISVQ